MGWLRLLREAGTSTLDDGLLDTAAALAFYFLFALFPTILLVAALLGAFHLQGLVHNLVAALTKDLPRQASALVSTQLGYLLESNVPGLISFDVIILFYSASQGFAGLMTGLNAAYETKETRSFAHRLGLQFALTLSTGILIAIALAVIVLGERILVLLTGRVHLGFALTLLWPLVRWAFTFGVMIVALMLLYRFAPNGVHRTVGTLPPVLFALAIWMVASAILASYVNNFATYSAVYGSLGAVIALMLWFYVFALAILFGAELHSAWLKLRRPA